MKPAPILSKYHGLEKVRAVFQVTSPVFGGGSRVESDELRRQLKTLDRDWPIRIPSIRGQLRFWWRATRGTGYSSIAEMREAESRIWGATSRGSVVRLSLEKQPTGASISELDVFDLKQSAAGKWNPRARAGFESIAYGAFPLQPKGNLASRVEAGKLTVITGEWELIALISTGDVVDDFRDALTAWLSFGGLGARTRRGFGAVGPHKGTVDPVDVQSRWAALPIGQEVSGIPSLRGSRLCLPDKVHASGLDALSFGLGKLRDFRQAPGIGRNPPSQEPGNKRPAGRSRWPEADAVRRLTRQRSPRHASDVNAVDSFPRAGFGMPVIFHFADQGDPADTTLKPREHERMASPLILRPFLRADGSFGCLALLLSGTRATDQSLELEWGANSRAVTPSLTSVEAHSIKPLEGQSDPLTAFLKFFGK